MIWIFTLKWRAWQGEKNFLTLNWTINLHQMMEAYFIVHAVHSSAKLTMKNFKIIYKISSN